MIAVLLSVIFGEGVMGWGIYWPFLLLLLDWEGVYWFSLVVGILLSVFRGIPVGLPSVFILLVVGGLSIVMGARKEMRFGILLVAILVDFVFDKAFGLNFSFWEMIAVVLCGFVGIRWFEKGETIRITY